MEKIDIHPTALATPAATATAWTSSGKTGTQNTNYIPVKLLEYIRPDISLSGTLRSQLDTMFSLRSQILRFALKLRPCHQHHYQGNGSLWNLCSSRRKVVATDFTSPGTSANMATGPTTPTTMAPHLLRFYFKFYILTISSSKSPHCHTMGYQPPRLATQIGRVHNFLQMMLDCLQMSYHTKIGQCLKKILFGLYPRHSQGCKEWFGWFYSELWGVPRWANWIFYFKFFRF